MMKQEGSRNCHYDYLLLRDPQRACCSPCSIAVSHWGGSRMGGGSRVGVEQLSERKGEVRACRRQAEGTQLFNAWALIPLSQWALPLHASLWSLEPERREALGAERQPCVAFALQALRQPGASERVWRWRRAGPRLIFCANNLIASSHNMSVELCAEEAVSSIIVQLQHVMCYACYGARVDRHIQMGNNSKWLQRCSQSLHVS